MAVRAVEFGVLLRRWRASRGMSQTTLALAAKSSTRHLSYLETGRSRPSRDMVLRLGEQLNLSLRDQNLLLLAAGFAPAFAERSLEEMSSARSAMEQILQVHLPYPAYVLDRHWNVVLSNAALPQLYEGCSPELLRSPVNAVRLTLHPDGMGPRVENFVEWRAHTVTVLKQQLQARADPVIQALLTEVLSYPAPRGAMALAMSEGSQRYASPLRVQTRFGRVSFLNTTTVFGAPADVTLSELALEMLFPADAATIAIVKDMVDEAELAAGGNSRASRAV
ncbi:helix-turn-helix transcriptional regulator [Bradyrhizobium liaoningense]|uniref:helix-turn-helix domain-containing protein n=1 Tax=Bradyrhizobium liaoningense TaxID=43992 RepID=UPI001BA4C905|nr:helix-turn-helix transcriptional regulator [Bradyrhizobium liaoningense]MBR0839200.1 helix-turn-helix transcriptional regulator [Bradyrhizobium liaoningense]